MNKSPKNIKKVIAGKKRANTALRIKGRFVSKGFQNEIQRIKEVTGTTGSLQTFFNQHENEFTDLYTSGELRSAIEKSDTTIFSEALKIRGDIYIRKGEEESIGDKTKTDINNLKFQVLTFEQYVFANYNCAGIAFKPAITFFGDIIIDIPDTEYIDDNEFLDEELIEYCRIFYVIIYISDPDKKKNKQKGAAIKKRINSKKKQIKTKLSDVSSNRKRTRKGKG